MPRPDEIRLLGFTTLISLILSIPPGAPSFFKHPSSAEQIQDLQITSSAQTMAKIEGAPGYS